MGIKEWGRNLALMAGLGAASGEAMAQDPGEHLQAQGSTTTESAPEAGLDYGSMTEEQRQAKYDEITERKRVEAEIRENSPLLQSLEAHAESDGYMEEIDAALEEVRVVPEPYEGLEERMATGPGSDRKYASIDIDPISGGSVDIEEK